MPPAGKYNRRITFERRVEARSSAYNRPSVSFEPIMPKAWAQVQDILPSRENVTEGVVMANRPCKIRCRYREDITGDMRIDYRGRKLRIVAGPVEVGQREEIELLAENWSTEGIDP